MIVRIGRRRHDRADHRVEGLEQLAPLRAQRARAAARPSASRGGSARCRAAARRQGLSSGASCGCRGLRAGIGIRLERTRPRTTSASAYRAGRTPRSPAAAGSRASTADARLAEVGRRACRSRRARLPVGISGSVSITSTRKPFSVVVPRRRQREPVADAGFQRVRAGDHVEQQRKVGGAARHRPDHREVAVERQRRKRRRRVAARCGTNAKVGLCA